MTHKLFYRSELDDSLLARIFLEEDYEFVVLMFGRLVTRTILDGFTVSCVAFMFKSLPRGYDYPKAL